MTINLLTPEQLQSLLVLQINNPTLTFQSKGYNGLNRSNFTDAELKADKEINKILKETIQGFSRFQNFTDAELKADKEINKILKESIQGFSRFQNFKLDKDKNIHIRFQYNWSHDDPKTITFIGAGYLELFQLLNGFEA